MAFLFAYYAWFDLVFFVYFCVLPFDWVAVVGYRCDAFCGCAIVAAAATVFPTQARAPRLGVDAVAVCCRTHIFVCLDVVSVD